MNPEQFYELVHLYLSIIGGLLIGLFVMLGFILLELAHIKEILKNDFTGTISGQTVISINNPAPTASGGKGQDSILNDVGKV